MKAGQQDAEQGGQVLALAGRSVLYRRTPVGDALAAADRSAVR